MTDTSQTLTTKFKLGDKVYKIKGSSWRGTVVGTYSTKLTPEGYAVESDTETGSVQIYPAAALEKMSITAPQHVCGLQGFGALDDTCPACDAENAAHQKVCESLQSLRHEDGRLK